MENWLGRFAQKCPSLKMPQKQYRKNVGYLDKEQGPTSTVIAPFCNKRQSLLQRAYSQDRKRLGERKNYISILLVGEKTVMEINNLVEVM